MVSFTPRLAGGDKSLQASGALGKPPGHDDQCVE